MNVLGLIVEYNPFHNGHLHHLKESKKLSNADYVICVMSGNYIQRGEPAIINKWSRTKMALNAGIDLVIELPTVYAMSTAEFFSFGAVKILDSLGIVNNICFGSECGDVNSLERIADVLVNEPYDYKCTLKNSLSEGLSFPVAREVALSKYFGTNFHNMKIVNSSNNILGIEYIKALKKLNSSIKPITIQRIHNSYNSTDITGSISSATAVRKHILSKGIDASEDILNLTVPTKSAEIFKDEVLIKKNPISLENFEDILLYKLRNMSLEEIKSLPYVTEGLENRIKKAVNTCGSIYEVIDNINTKRYTQTRIQRILLSTLTSINNLELQQFNYYGGPQYIKILGFNANGRHLLSEIKKRCRLPIITKPSNFKNTCNPLIKRMLEIESISTDNYVLGYKNPEFKVAGQEYTSKLIIIK